MNLYRTVQPFGSAFCCMLALLSIGERQALCQSQPRVQWSVPAVSIVLPPGESVVTKVSLSSSAPVQNVSLEAVPEIARIIAIQPQNIPSLAPNQPQVVNLTFSVPVNSAIGILEGTIHLRTGSRTLPDTLKVTVGISSQRVSITAPTGFSINANVLSQGGPVALNNFGSKYQSGGVLPPSGAEIDITRRPLPPPPLNDAIALELDGSMVTASKPITVSGLSCTQISYTDVFTPSLTYKNEVVYCPAGGSLYKVFLSYRAGDPQESAYLLNLQQLLVGTVFLP
jgi:hypothetical protein